MRVLFSVSAWPGHYFPMVPLARALGAAGHEVRVLCAASQATSVQAAGLPAVPVLDGLDMVLQARLSHFWQAQAGDWPYPWLPVHPVTGQHLSRLEDFDSAAYRAEHRAAALAATARSFDAAVRFATGWRPDLVVHDRLSLEGVLAARVVSVPAVAHLWGPVGTAEEGALRLVPGDPTRSFARHGVAELGDPPFRTVIDPCPPALCPPVGAAHRLDVRYVPYAGGFGGSCPPRPRVSGRPRVCVVWGTSLTAMAGARSFVVPEILAGLTGAGLDVTVLVSAADAAALRVPPATTVFSDVALASALSGADVVVHHGGAGCVMTSVAAGVPQVAVTFAAEQAANADRVAATGAGLHVRGGDFDAGAVRAAVTDVIADLAYGRAARWLRDQNDRRPTPAGLVARLEDLAGARAPASG
ncbi:DUF1205 domain-containing protein [Amorphoplanes nipponensis]|uniref:Glycosyl transferase n=2 Tax=Actinoplanes nipponensis TaxID=135950 RepID=A0A919JE74_9ACTN|nr:glycosyl transferase [Actinoplanes nipponensis]